MKKNRITRETMTRLLVIGAYQEFLKEWLDLYDIYMMNNPPVKAELQANCLFELANGVLNKEFYFLQTNNLTTQDMYHMLHDYIDRLVEYENGKFR